MPIYFIRHGKSQANEQNRFAGRTFLIRHRREMRTRRRHARRRLAALAW